MQCLGDTYSVEVVGSSPIPLTLKLPGMEFLYFKGRADASSRPPGARTVFYGITDTKRKEYSIVHPP